MGPLEMAAQLKKINTHVIVPSLRSKTLPFWNLCYHSPAVNTTSIVIQSELAHTWVKRASGEAYDERDFLGASAPGSYPPDRFARRFAFHIVLACDPKASQLCTVAVLSYVADI